MAHNTGRMANILVKVNLCNFPEGKMTALWVTPLKYSNDPEFMQNIISDYSARGRGNKIINASHHNRKNVYHTHTHNQGSAG